MCVCVCISYEGGIGGVCVVGGIRTKDAAATCLANYSISLSKMVFLAVFHQGIYPLVPSAGRGLSHSSRGSRWVGGTQWVGGVGGKEKDRGRGWNG